MTAWHGKQNGPYFIENIFKGIFLHESFPDSKVHGANMGPTWVLSSPDGPHVGPMNLAIRVAYLSEQTMGCLLWVWSRLMFCCCCCSAVCNSVQCQYNIVNFLQNPQNRHSIARPRGRDMGVSFVSYGRAMECLLWVQSLISILLN